MAYSHVRGEASPRRRSTDSQNAAKVSWVRSAARWGEPTSRQNHRNNPA